MPQPAPMQASRGIAAYDRAIAAALSETGITGVKEVLDYSFFDSVTIATGTAQTSQLFQTPTSNVLNSNFYGSGFFPQGQAFLVRSLRFIPAPAASAGPAVADLQALLVNTTVTLQVENAKKYFEGPALFLPPGVGPTLEYVAGTAASIGTGISTANNGRTFRSLPFLSLR